MDEGQDYGQDQRVYEAGDVAERLGLSGAGLRRLAPIYERVMGNLPRDRRGGRLWTSEAMGRLERARDMVRGGRAPSVEAALRFEVTGDDVDLYPPPRRPVEANLVALLEELRGLRAAVEHQNHLLEEQGRRLDALEAPEQPSASSKSAPDASEGSEPRSDPEGPQTGLQRPWWRRIFGG